MINLNSFYFLNVITLITLMLISTYGAIEMLTNLWTDRLVCPKRVSKTAGWVLVLVFFDCLYWMVTGLLYDPFNAVMLRAGCSLDLLLYLSVFMIGEAILYPKTYSWKTILLYYTIPLVLGVLNPLLDNEYVEVAFMLYTFICIIVMSIRHLKQPHPSWCTAVIVFVVIIVALYMGVGATISIKPENHNCLLLLYSISNLLSGLVWLTIVRRLRHLEDVAVSE